MIPWLVNPLCLFLMVWGVAVVLYLGGVVVGTFPSPRPLTVGVVLLNIGTFSLGYLTWSLFQNPSPQPTGLGESHGTAAGFGTVRPLTRKRLARVLQFLLLVGLAILLLELYRIGVLAGHCNTSWSYLITHPEVLRPQLITFIATGVFQTRCLVMLLSLANSFFSIGFVLLGVFLYLDRTRWKYVYLSAFLVITLVIGLIHLSRYEMTANILHLVLAYAFMYARDSARFQRSRCELSRFRLQSSHFQLLVPVVAVVLLFLAIDLLLGKSGQYAQANRLQGFGFHLYWYIASPLAALNEFLTTFSGRCEWGQNTFFPFYKWLCRFHLAQPAEISLYGEKVYLPFVANTYTYLRAFYEDFGIVGVAVAPYLLGGTLAVVRRHARRGLHYLNLYIVLLIFILFSFYNYFLMSSQNYLQILLGFLFFRYRIEELP